jgi:hypothetical protein
VCAVDAVLQLANPAPLQVISDNPVMPVKSYRQRKPDVTQAHHGNPVGTAPKRIEGYHNTSLPNDFGAGYASIVETIQLPYSDRKCI